MSRFLGLIGLMVTLAGPAAAAEAPKLAGTLEFYVHQPGPCGIELAHAKPPLFLYVDKRGEIYHDPDFKLIPAIVPFTYRCGDCTAQGEVFFRLRKAFFKRVGPKKTLYVKVEVDNTAVLRCHPMNPLNHQKFSPAPFEAEFVIPWEDGYVFTRPGMWYHFALRLEK
ncbi:MAG: hypothetical protein WHT07_03275 [Desulfobaccales bacterium]